MDIKQARVIFDAAVAKKIANPKYEPSPAELTACDLVVRADLSPAVASGVSTLSPRDA